MEHVNNGSTVVAPMNGGDGKYSYAHNSTYQRKVVDGVSGLIREGIAKSLDISSSLTFHLADLGCSVGPNTFTAMQNIIESIQEKCQAEILDPEFQVLFNDHTSNDFNKLFASFPRGKEYFAAAVPGSFFNRLFPKNSIHFVHSSASLHWLSRVPKDVMDVNSPSYNKGRIHHGGAPKEVMESYLAQFHEDMESFFVARAEEVVKGGLMALSLLTRPKRLQTEDSVPPHPVDTLGSCLMEMAQEGRFSEAKVDSFNIPVCVPSVEAFEEAIENNGCFSIENMQVLDINTFDVKVLGVHLRAIFGGLLSEHFGNEIMDDLFARFTETAAQIYTAGSTFDANLFVLLKRK